jgi:hypothetical protein
MDMVILIAGLAIRSGMVGTLSRLKSRQGSVEAKVAIAL